MRDTPHYDPPLASEKIFSDRKTFFVDLKENQRGRFVKVTEDANGRRQTLMLPMEATLDFLEALRRLIAFEALLRQENNG